MIYVFLDKVVDSKGVNPERSFVPSYENGEPASNFYVELNADGLHLMDIDTNTILHTYVYS